MKLVSIAIATLVVAALVGAAAAADEAATLQASVALTNRGPLHVCSAPCGGADTTWQFIYVSNRNSLGDVAGHTANRTTLPHSFVVTDVEETIFVDGELYSNYTFTPPPNANFPTTYAGHWPSTVTCPPGGPPCNVVGSPAVIPGESAAVVYVGWAHAAGEPNGRYVFRFTIHGTIDGEPAEVTASTPPILMTD